MKFEKELMQAGFEDILGQDDAKKQLKSALLMGRNVILVGAPGIGKTTLAKNVAKIIYEKTVNDCPYHCDPKNPLCPDCKEKYGKKQKIPTKKISGMELFIRVQGSPDLTAEDLIGDIDPIKAMKFGPMSIEAFSPGKIFKANQGVLFFDELNRCSEKLQNAMLQALEEKRVTIGSYNVDIDVDFIFIGTMNPEDTSTEPLSDVFLDRFDIIYIRYPESIEIEKQIVHKVGKKIMEFPDHLLEAVITFIRELRLDENIEKKPSVRATLGIYERAQSNAKVNGRDVVSLQDIQDVLISVISHRIRLKPSVKYLQKPEEYIEQEFRRFCEKQKGGYL